MTNKLKSSQLKVFIKNICSSSESSESSKELSTSSIIWLLIFPYAFILFRNTWG